MQCRLNYFQSNEIYLTNTGVFVEAYGDRPALYQLKLYVRCGLCTLKTHSSIQMSLPAIAALPGGRSRSGAWSDGAVGHPPARLDQRLCPVVSHIPQLSGSARQALIVAPCGASRQADFQCQSRRDEFERPRDDNPRSRPWRVVLGLGVAQDAAAFACRRA